MSMIKRGTCKGKVAFSQALYECPACGHKDVEKGGSPDGFLCPSCGTPMVLAAGSEKALNKAPEQPAGQPEAEQSK